jgi:hypothetical protein
MGRFDAFNIISTTYKVVKGHGISVDIIAPKTLSAENHPVIARFHGGFLVCAICCPVNLNMLDSIAMN